MQQINVNQINRVIVSLDEISENFRAESVSGNNAVLRELETAILALSAVKSMIKKNN